VASIGDVAARAAVSVATVSRALRGLPNVAPSTRNRVLAAAKELDYVVDPHASRLAAGRTQTIGIVVPLFTQWYFTQVVAGAEGVLAASGYDLLLYNVGGPQGRHRFLSTLPFRKRVDGIIVIDLPLSADQQATLTATGVPMVFVGIPSERVATVTIDNVAAAASAVRHLTNLGHQRIGLIANLPDDPLHFTAPLERRAGYQAALEQAGLPVHPELDVPGNFSMSGGAEAMAQLLSTGVAPTAVFAESDEMAIGALKTVRDTGLRVPDELSLIGFDDHEIAEYVGLTTVHQPVLAQGETAAAILMELMAPQPPAEPPHIVMPTSVRVRTTTGPMRRSRAEPVGALPD
jgi:LacI family transcriptional regulator, repressor for deo operon, udp, cdd, tsx, nupC, and nupG